jgi:hypothetical protein
MESVFPSGLGNRNPQSPGPVGYNNGQENIMVTKNWKSISTVGNEQLRLNLITSSGDVTEGLSRGFPEHFLTEGQEHPRMTREELLALVGKMERRDDVVKACKDAGIPHQRFGFSGSCRGTTDGVPYANGGYDTTANGWGDYFWKTSKHQGEVLEYKDAQWLVVWNGSSKGNAHCFGSHSLVIVPIAALSDVLLA